MDGTEMDDGERGGGVRSRRLEGRTAPNAGEETSAERSVCVGGARRGNVLAADGRAEAGRRNPEFAHSAAQHGEPQQARISTALR